MAEELKSLLLKTPNPIINSSQFVDANQMKAMDTLLKKSAKNQHKRSLNTTPKCENEILRMIKMSNGDSWYNKPSKDWGNINQRYGSYLAYVTAMMEVPSVEQPFAAAYGAYHTLMAINKKGDKKASSDFARELIADYVEQFFNEQSPEANNILYHLLKEKLAADKHSNKKNRSKSDKSANLAETIFVDRYEQQVCANYFARLTDESFYLDERIRDLMQIKEQAPDIAVKLYEMLQEVDDEEIDVDEILAAYKGDKEYDLLDVVPDEKTPGSTAGHQDYDEEQSMIQQPQQILEQTPQYHEDDDDLYSHHQNLVSTKKFNDAEEDDDMYDEPGKQTPGNTTGYPGHDEGQLVSYQTPQYYEGKDYNHYPYQQNLPPSPTKQFDDDDEEDDAIYDNPDEIMNNTKGQVDDGTITTATPGEGDFYEGAESEELGRKLLALENHYEELEEIWEDEGQATKGAEMDNKIVSDVVSDAINNIEEAWKIDSLSNDDRLLLRDKGKELEKMIGKLIDKNLLKKHEYKGQVISDKENAMFSNKKDDANEVEGNIHQVTKNVM
ncbi:MAG: hypothetical protein GY821_08530 [Gammaproteobacteria bacterium]|nr:hypothetical protein [Gammaproteobacteria bacterium]